MKNFDLYQEPGRKQTQVTRYDLNVCLKCPGRSSFASMDYREAMEQARD